MFYYSQLIVHLLFLLHCFDKIQLGINLNVWGESMSNVFIPSYLSRKILPSNNGNIITFLKEKYNWVTYGDITELELEKVYNNDFDKFWTIIKYLTFQGFKFNGMLNRYDFTSGKEIGYHLYLHKQQQGSLLDYEYRYAFLKLQLVPYGIYDKYDLHLLPLDHVLHENLNLEKAKDFFEEEGFSVLTIESIIQKEKFSTLSNNKRETLSTEKKLVFYVGNSRYLVPKENGTLPLSAENLPDSKVLRVLMKKGYKKVSDLPSDLNFLLMVPHVGQKSIENFMKNIGSNFGKSIGPEELHINFEGNTIQSKESLLYLGEELPIKKEWMQLPIMEEKIDEDLRQLFDKYRFKILGDLPTDIGNFLRKNGYSKGKSQKLSSKVFNLLPIQSLKELFSHTLKFFVNKEKPKFLNERDWEILQLRVSGVTLEQIGKKFEISRERVRQIVKKSFDSMFKQYQKYFEYITDKIKKNLFVNINSLFEKDDLNIMRSIIEVYDLPFNIYKDYLYTGSREDFIEMIDNFKSNINKSRSETYIYTREEIEEYVVDFLTDNMVKGDNTDAKHVETLVNDLIKESFESTNVHNQYVYKQKLTKARMCQIVFEKEFSNGLNVYKEIDKFVEKLLQYYPEEFRHDSERSIIANLTRDEEIIILWKVGYFKHISAIHPDINANTLAPIKDWLQSQLNENNIQINTRAAFGKFANVLKKLEIDTEHALFSLLKIHFPKAFNYSRSPNLVMVGHERKEKKKIIEDFVRGFNGYVKNETLINHFIKTLGWKQTMYEQNVAASEFLIKTSDGLIHVDCLGLEKEDLESIFTYTKGKINQLKNSFSIETVFEERKSTLLQMNIKDSKVLYHLLEKYYPEEFDFYRYPHIHPVGKYKVEQLSVAGQFETFFLEQDDYFDRDELHEEFIQERGWARSTYYAAFNKTKDIILEVYPNEFAHVNLIEWTKEKEETLIEVLESYLKEKNKPFIHIDRDIINNNNLIARFPEINPMFDWNHTLLVSILQNIDYFVLLGTKKAGIILKNNPFGIQNEQDFISYLLRNKFDGFVKISDLQKYLYRIDMCGFSSIPQYYLTSENKELDYRLVNDEVILNELVEEQ